jgi:hypothetical protein
MKRQSSLTPSWNSTGSLPTSVECFLVIIFGLLPPIKMQRHTDGITSIPCQQQRWGKLACLVLSKILGIGTVKRNWKQVKAVKSGQQVNTGINKTKEQVLIYAQYQQTRAQVRMSKLSAAGKLWEDEDFTSMKMDTFCKEIKKSLNVEETEQLVRVLGLWQERWELNKVGPQEDSILEALLTKKYLGLKFFDIDDNNRVTTVHKMIFQKKTW